MPEPKDIPQETIGEFKQPNYEKVYYKTDQDYLYLSMFVNWVFTDLDRSFDEAFGDHFHRVYYLPKRPLYVLERRSKCHHRGQSHGFTLRSTLQPGRDRVRTQTHPIYSIAQ